MGLPLIDFPDACLIVDGKNKIVGINQAGEKLLNIKHSDAVGKLVDEVLSRRSISLAVDGFLQDGWKGTNLQPDNGQKICAELKVSFLKGPDGNLLGRITILRDLDLSTQNDTLRNKNAVLTAFQETTFDLHSSLDLEVVLKNIVQRACKLLGASQGYLDLLIEEADELVPVVGIGGLEHTLGYSVKRGEGVAGTVWATGKPLVVDNYDQWPGRTNDYSYGVIRSIIGMPLKLKEKVVGVFGVAHGFDNDIVFSEEAVSVLDRFGDLAAVALQNARLYEEAQKEIEFRRKTEVELRDANQLLQLQIERIELLQEQLKELAVRDSLTNLFNRRYLQEMLEVEFARSRRSGTSLAILMMDSDRLKDVNDKYGHKAGDDFLVHIAEVVQSSIRAGDIACRYGGDEFVVVLSNVAEEIALERAEKLRENIAKHYIVYKNESVSISVSIGIAVFPGHGSSGETLLQKADQALYRAKQMGKNRIVVYSEERG
ncbi:MAG: diguanylate cyclase [Anaerolineales bacterium]|nr:diguanylate cyclase [Anaerolineales bacterium]